MKYSTSKMPWSWNRTRVPLRSLIMSPFDRARMTSYWRYIVLYGSISCRFWDIQCRKTSWPGNPFQRSIKVIDSGTIRKNGYGFLLMFCSNFVRKIHRFWDIRLVSRLYSYLETRVRGLLMVIGTNRNRSTAYDFLLTFHSTKALSYRFRDKRRFQSKIANSPRILCASAEGVRVGIEYRR